MQDASRLIWFIACLWGFHTLSTGQEIRCSAQDRMDFEKRAEVVHSLPTTDPGKSIVAIGKTFLGTRYQAHTLEYPKELLVINFQGLDCTTFIENVLAFYLLKQKKGTSFEDFVAILQKIRYRNGQIDGYSSRLHYFTEWIANNEEKGIIRDITRDLGGHSPGKIRNFMSKNRDAYEALSDDTQFKALRLIENDLEQTPYLVVRQKELDVMIPKLKDGDIIAFATSIDGLDVTHTGVAVQQGEQMHLLHASSSGEVEISAQPLADYTREIKHNTGLIVARLVE